MSTPVPGWAPHPLRRWLRKPVLFWTLAATLALATYVLITALAENAASLKAEYGTTRTVLVTSDAVAAGDALIGAIVSADLPAALLPDDALLELAPEALAVHAIGANTVITESNTTAATVPTDGAVLGIPITPLTPPASIGADVWLVANVDPFAGIEPSTIAAVVIGADEAQLQVVVDRDDLLDAAAALQAGVVTVAVIR